MRSEEHDRYTENPAGYISSILKMPVVSGFNQDEITSIIEPYVDKKISVSEKNILRDELNRAGIEGSQLQVLLRETRYEYVSASNSAWYKITKVG